MESNTQNTAFNSIVRPYLVLRVAFALAITIVGIPLAVIWLCGVGQWWAKLYYERLYCSISDRRILFRKGIIFHVEKTIPLENIQDVTFIEGPLLRRFHLSILRFETAGQSAGQAHDMQLVGIVDAHKFRDNIIARRDNLRARMNGEVVSSGDADFQYQVLQKLDRVIDLMERRQS